MDVAGADWLVVEFDGWLVVDGAEVELDPEEFVWVWANGGELVVEPFGDCAKAAVPKTRPTAVLTNSFLFILELGTMSAATSCPGNIWPCRRLDRRERKRSFTVNKVIISLALGASAVFATAASASPISNGIAVTSDSGIENVRLVCNEYGRCWRSRGPRYIQRSYDDDDGYYARRSYNYYGGPGYYSGPAYGGYYGGGPSFGFSFGSRGW